MDVAQNLRLAIAYLIEVVKYALLVGAVLVIVFNIWSFMRKGGKRYG